MKEMRAALSDKTAWLWEGYLAPGNVTLLTSLSKSGKTTLLSVLLSKLAGGELAGLPVRPSTALVLSEETSALWCGRADRVRFSHRVRWLCRPFRSKPQPEEWQALLDRVLEERRQKGLDLFVIDTLASFSPSRNENNAGSMLAALLPLQALTAAGLCVLILHHPTKGNPMPGQAARGSGALAGCVDIILEMRPFAPGDADDRRRLLQGYSRHDETPRTLAIEWTADGADYRVLGELVSNNFTDNWELLMSVLADKLYKMTRQEIRANWPPDFPTPSDTTLWSWLERGVTDDMLEREGNGLKGMPFRYWLKGSEKYMMPDLPPLPSLGEMSGLL